MNAPTYRPSIIGRLGRSVRQRAALVLGLLALTANVLLRVPQPDAWRRPVRSEFRRALHQAAGGALAPVLLTAALVGLGMVYQAVYWLQVAGQEGMIGRVLVTVLVRELAPLMVGLILLGRSGMVLVVELGALQSNGQVQALEALGLEPFPLILFPRATAMAAAGFALGVLFVCVALATGFVSGSAFGALQSTPGQFLDTVLGATSASDFVIFPMKAVLIGIVVALSAGITALAARPGEAPATLLPRGFARGVIAVLVTTIALTLAAA